MEIKDMHVTNSQTNDRDVDKLNTFLSLISVKYVMLTIEPQSTHQTNMSTRLSETIASLHETYTKRRF